MFNCVISSSSDLENIYRFYSEEELFEAGTVNFNYVNPVGLKDETLSRITQKNFRVHRLAYIKMILSVLEKRKWDAQSRLLRRELQDIELLYEQLHSHVAEGKKHIMVVHAFLQLEDYLWIQKVNFFHVKEFRKKIQKCASEVWIRDLILIK